MDDRIAGSRVGIVGGSIGGCAAAIALMRAGCDVTIFERAPDELRDRGHGIVIPLALRDELIVEGYLDRGYPAVDLSGRHWLVRDGDAPMGRLLWHQVSQGAANNWGILWRALRIRLSDERYRDGVTVTAIADGPDGMTVTTLEGGSETFDIVIGADGYRSVVRRWLDGGKVPPFAGYVMWRGSFEEERLTNPALLDALAPGERDRAHYFVGFEGGHLIAYFIPGFDHEDAAAPGHRRFNWGIYGPPPPGLDFREPVSIPAGFVSRDTYAVLERLLDAHLPPAVAGLVRLNTPEEVSIQAVYDQVAERYVHGRVLLLGDAATVSRPHTASGATKALQDARALERITLACETWTDALALYDAERRQAGNDIVELGRRLGRAQVEAPPDYRTVDSAMMEAWTQATLSGGTSYLYGASRS